jgi:ubiquinone/menaquinone biosynthesis C-methylase UbiE
MGSPDVDQLSFLSSAFREALELYDCETVALLGCATGNGLEHINKAATQKVTAIDINSEYLEILRQRYEKSVLGLEILRADLEICPIGNQEYSLVFAGLVFEYLKPRKVLRHISGGLRPGGVMVGVLQLPAVHLNKITETPYTSIKKLKPIMKLISPEDFKLMANEGGLNEIEGKRVILKSGKPFYVGTYAKG